MLEERLKLTEGPAAPADEELEARWKQGSTPAFALLFERWHGRVFSFALRLSQDRHLAEDLAQRAFVKLYQKPPPGTGRAAFRTLLFTIVRNELWNERRNAQRRRGAGSVEAEGVGGPDPSPAEAADRLEERDRVRAALATLDEEDREVVLLRETEGLSVREVAEVTGLTRDAVCWRLARGLEALRRELGALNVRAGGTGEERAT